MITICIPSFRRKRKLKNLLKYYSEVGINFEIFIGLSDEVEIYEEIIRFKDDLKISKQISVFHTPNMDVIETMSHLISNADSEYAILNCDDDYLVPSTLSSMQDYLDKNKSYEAVNSRILLFNADNNLLYPYKMKSLLSESASERLIQFSEDYFGILFSLFRLKHLQDIYSVPQLKSDILREEIYGSYSATLIGRIAHIGKVSSIRGYGHERREMDKVIDEDSERIFIDDLSSKLSLIDNISLKQSQKILEKAFRNYFTKRVKNPNQNLPRLLRIILRILRRLFSKPKLQYRDIVSFSKTNNEIRLACMFLDMENEANS